MLLLLASLDPADDILKLAVHYWGPAGFIIFILLSIIIYLYRRIEKLQDIRITEHKESSEKMSSLVRELDNTVKDLTHTMQNFLLSRNSGG